MRIEYKIHQSGIGLFLYLDIELFKHTNETKNAEFFCDHLLLQVAPKVCVQFPDGIPLIKQAISDYCDEIRNAINDDVVFSLNLLK